MPPIDYSASPSWLQWVIGALAIMALLAGIYGFSRKLWPVLRKFVRTIESLDDLPQFMMTTAASLQAQDEQFEQTTKTLADQGAMLVVIKHEVLPNGGGSLRDDVTDIKKRLDHDEDQLAEIEKTRPAVRKRPTKPRE